MVVIGNGMAGIACVENILRYEKRFDITVFGDENCVNYNRIGLSAMLAGEKTEEDLILNPLEWYEKNNIKLHLGERAARLDRCSKTIQTNAGRYVRYDKTLIATGSSAFVPPVPGADLKGVETFRTMKDAKKLLNYAARGGNAVVIGGGLLGLECARGLQLQGMFVTCLHLVGHLMEMQLDQTGGRLVLEGIKRLGINVILGARTEALQGDGLLESVRLSDGIVLPANLAVMACGIRPRVELARAAGLAVNRGIVVDNAMRTSDPDIFAVGECAEHAGKVYGLVAPLYDQARVAAAHIAGKIKAAYLGSTVATSLKVAGVNVFSAGLPNAENECETIKYEDLHAGVYRRLLVKNDRLAGAILVGDLSDSHRLTKLIRCGDQLGELRKTLLTGESPDSGAAATAILDAPDDELVCGCHGVVKGSIKDAIVSSGLTDLKGVRQATKASTGCGSCACLVESLLKKHAGNAYIEQKKDALCECYDFTLAQLRAIAETQQIKSVSELAAIYADKPYGCSACKPALAYMMDELWCGEHTEDRAYRFINDRVHANIQNDGSFSVAPRIRGGVTSPEALIKIAAAAQKFNVPVVKITGSQRIDLLGVQKEDLPKIWEELDMPCGHAFAKAVRMVKTCVGSAFCRFGVQDSMAAGIELEKRLENLYTPAKFKMGVSGCPRNCAEATVKDLGLAGIDGGWQVVVGGAAGKSVRKADLLCLAKTTEEALDAAALFFQYYREQANYNERTYDFVPRHGMERIKAETIFAAEKTKNRLRERLRKSKQKSNDPWLERVQPKTRTQFEPIKAEAMV